MRSRTALILLCLALAGCQCPRLVRVEARYQSLAPPMSAALSLTVER